MSAAASAQDQIARSLARRPRESLRALAAQIAATGAAGELTYAGDDGEVHVVPLLAAPAILARGDVSYLHRLCRTLLGATRKVAAAWQDAPDVRAILPIDPDEHAWFALAPSRAFDAPLLGRFDLNIDPRRGARAAELLEWNGCAVGGIHLGPGASELVASVLAPEVAPQGLRVPASMRDAWLEQCVAHARARGARGAVHLVWLEDRSWDAGITEGPTLCAYARAAGHRARVADPRELELRRGELFLDGARLDLVYRGMELRDLIAIEQEDRRPLLAVRAAVAQDRVLSPLHGDLDHKSLLELWSSPAFARMFSRAERAAFARHVPWTRALTARHTEGPRGARIDLPRFVARHRSTLVLKPSRACGGEGILLGRHTSSAAWERAIARSLSGRAPQTVQTYVRGATLASPVVRGRRIAHERHFTAFGLMASPRHLGILGRASPMPVVNVSRGGGILGVLVR